MLKIQENTHQVPCGPHSLINECHSLKVQPFAVCVYLLLNYYSNWDTGQTHGISLREIAKKLCVFDPDTPHTSIGRVANAIRLLVAGGWIEKNVRGNGQANTYKIIHHNCAPREIPLDSDGRPKKCAVPYGEGSAFEKMFDGVISWKACLLHTIAKVVSDWTTGSVQFTIAEARKWLRFSRQTICNLRKSLVEKGLFEEIGHRARGFFAKILPAPYEKRRKRRDHQQAKGMRTDGNFYYSYNERWKVCRQTGKFYTKEMGRWRSATEYELERTNSKILRDFVILRDAIFSLLKLKS